MLGTITLVLRNMNDSHYVVLWLGESVCDRVLSGQCPQMASDLLVLNAVFSQTFVSFLALFVSRRVCHSSH